MSPNITTAAPTSSPSALSPRCSEPLVGPVKSRLTANTTGRPRNSARIRSGSWPITTTTGESPAESARRTTRRISDSPSSSRSILFFPMRLDAPAARITPATWSGEGSVRRGMDRGLAVAQRPGAATRAHCENLGNHGERYLLRPVGADVEAHRAVHARVVHRAPLGREVPENALGTLTRAQHSDVGG